MAYGEQSHIDADVLDAIQEENHTEQKQQVIVAGHHVFCTEIGKREKIPACTLFHESSIPLSDAVGHGVDAQQRQKDEDNTNKRLV